MFDVGFAELVLIFVLGLLILGPERLPRVAAQLGRWVARARRTASQLRRQLERELELNELMRPRPPASRPAPPPSPPASGADSEAGSTADCEPKRPTDSPPEPKARDSSAEPPAAS